MSEANVRLVRRSLEDFNRGDFDALFPEPDRAFEWHDQPELPGASIHHGTEAAAEHLRSTLRDMPGYRVDPQEFLDAGRAVVVCGRVSAHGRGSGVPVDRSFFAVFFVESGRVRSVRILGTRAEGLEAAGLSE